MCLIVYLPAGQRLTLDHVKDTQEYNPDGIGVMFPGPTKRPVTFRSLYSKGEDVLKLIARRVPDDVPYAIHFRRMTRGAKTLGNLHPFPLGKWGAVMHNGTLKHDVVGTVQADKGESDTLIFARDYLSKMPPEALESAGVQRLISVALDRDRMLTLSPGGFLRHNPARWFTNEQGWYMSNDYAMKKHELWGLPAKSAPKYQTYSYAELDDTDWTGMSGVGGHYRGYPPPPAPAPRPLLPPPAPAPRSHSDVYDYVDGQLIHDSLESSPLRAVYSVSIPGFIPRLNPSSTEGLAFQNSRFFNLAVAWMDYWRATTPKATILDYLVPSVVLLFALCYRNGPYVMSVVEFENKPNEIGMEKIRANAKRYLETDGRFTSRWAVSLSQGLTMFVNHQLNATPATTKE